MTIKNKEVLKKSIKQYDRNKRNPDNCNNKYK